MNNNTNTIPGWKQYSIVEVMALLIIGYIFCVRIVYAFSYDTNFEGVEFALVHFIQLISTKGSLYSEPDKFPFLIVVHAPLYYYMMAAITKLFSIDINQDIHTLYVAGRLISLALLLLDTWLLNKIVQMLIGKFKYTALILLLYVLFLPSHFFAIRPDSFKITFFLAFLFYSIKFYKTNNQYHNATALLFLLLSILCKQDVFAYAVLFYSCFFMVTRRRVYLVSLIMLVMLIIVSVLLFYAFTNVNLYKQLFLFNLQYDSDIKINLILIACHTIRALPLFIFSLLNLKSKDKFTFSIALISVLYFIISTLLMMRIGSNFNYVYESIVLMLLNIVLYFKEKQTSGTPVFYGLYIVFIILFNQIIYYRLIPDFKQLKNDKAIFIANQQAAEKIKGIVQDEVLFIPDMQYYIFYTDSRLIYGVDWHYDRYCDIALDIKIKPKFFQNSIVKIYDKQFDNGNVPYLLIADNQRSKMHMQKYYAQYKSYQKVDGFLLYKFENR